MHWLSQYQYLHLRDARVTAPLTFSQHHSFQPELWFPEFPRTTWLSYYILVGGKSPSLFPRVGFPGLTNIRATALALFS